MNEGGTGRNPGIAKGIGGLSVIMGGVWVVCVVALCAAFCCSCGSNSEGIESRALNNGSLRLLSDDQFRIRVIGQNDGYKIEISSSEYDVLGCGFGTSAEGNGACEIHRVAGAPFAGGPLKRPKKLIVRTDFRMKKLIYVNVITEEKRVVWNGNN